MRMEGVDLTGEGAGYDLLVRAREDEVTLSCDSGWRLFLSIGQ